MVSVAALPDYGCGFNEDTDDGDDWTEEVEIECLVHCAETGSTYVDDESMMMMMMMWSYRRRGWRPKNRSRSMNWTPTCRCRRIIFVAGMGTMMGWTSMALITSETLTTSPERESLEECPQSISEPE